MLGRNDVHTAARLFDPQRLTLAREFRGLTKNELAEKVGKTASAISQFESGRARPDGLTLGRVALALGLPAPFFAKVSDSLPLPLILIEACHFRSLRSATQKNRRMLLAKGALVSGLLSFLEQKVILPEEKLSPLIATPQDTEAIEAFATAIRGKLGLGLGPIGNMVNLLERNGIVVIPVDHECMDVDAFSLWNGKRPCIFLVMEKGSTSRSRMDAAHELGHLLMHVDAVPGSPELERQANQFASAFLLPKGSFYHEAPRRLDWEHIWELKRRWKVSAAAIIRRTYDFGIFSEATYRRAFMLLNQSGERGNEKHEPPEEKPVAIAKALDAIAERWPLGRIADELGLRAHDLHGLISFVGAEPPPLPDLEAEQLETKRAMASEGPLFDLLNRKNKE